jgi:hypothetical protein
MILDGYAAYLGKTLIDLEIAAVGREAGEANPRRVVDQLHGGLLRKQHHGRRFPCCRSAIRFFANEFLPPTVSHRPRRASTAIGVRQRSRPPPVSEGRYLSLLAVVTPPATGFADLDPS